MKFLSKLLFGDPTWFLMVHPSLLLFFVRCLSKNSFYISSINSLLSTICNSTLPWEHKICTIRGPPIVCHVRNRDYEKKYIIIFDPVV